MSAERGIFIRVELGEGCTAAKDGCRICADVCPVDIFDRSGPSLLVRGPEEDECTLCNLCVEKCPVAVISILRLYETAKEAKADAVRR